MVDPAPPPGAAEGVVVHDGTRILFVDDAAAQMLAINDVDRLGMPLASVIRSEDGAAVEAVDRKLDDEPLGEHRMTLRLRRRTGGLVPVNASFTRVSWRGTSATKLAVRPLRIKPQRFYFDPMRDGVDNGASEAIISTDERLRITSWNSAAAQMYGWSVDEVLGRHISAVLGSLHSRDASGEVIDEFASQDLLSRTVRHKHRDGSVLVVESFATLLRNERGVVVGLVEIIRPARRSAGAPGLDPLTGLPGRTRLLVHLESANNQESWTVVLIGLDQLNPRLDCTERADVLAMVAARLAASFGGNDFVVRLEGTRFGVCARADSAGEARAVFHRLARLIAEPLEVDGSLLSISTSLDATWGSAASCAGWLFERAERALLDSRAKCGKRPSFGEPGMESGAWQDDAIFATEEADALASGPVHVAYQPIVELTSGQLRTVEALARWDHPERGPRSPDRFVSLAERAGVIDELGEWILHQACVDTVKLSVAGIDVDLNVNLSTVQLRDPDIAQRVERVLARSGLAASRLSIEVAQSALVDENTTSPLYRLHDLGVHFVINDLGAGDATFRYLDLLAGNALKIDTSLVRGLVVDASDTTIRSVIDLGRALGLQIVAEGVDTEAQRARLLALDCRLGQGSLFGVALPYGELLGAYAQIGASPPSSASVRRR